MWPVINRKIVHPLIELVRKEPISRCFTDLINTQDLSYDQLRELQWEKLRKLLEYSYQNIPLYRNRFKNLGMEPQDIKTIEDFQQLGYLTKEDIRSSTKLLINSEFNSSIENCHSGGTLGKPINIMRDSLSSAYIRAAQLRGLYWYGIKKGDKQLRVWGMPFDEKLARRERRKDFLLNRIRISAFEISDATVRNYYKIIRDFKPRYIYGFTSAIYKICQIMNKFNYDGKALNVKYVVATTETLFQHQKSFIENFLNCRVINEYGCSEMGVIAFECPEGNLHVNMENVLVEFANEGVYGEDNCEIILTNLNSYSMPMIRYKIGDTGKKLKKVCPCGRHLELMSFEAGRVLSTLLGTDGRYVAGNVFCYLAFDIIETYGGIRDFRVIQKEKSRIEVTLSKDSNFNQRILDIFTQGIKRILGEDMQIKYIFVEEVPLERSGKRLFVHSELKDIF